MIKSTFLSEKGRLQYKGILERYNYISLDRVRKITFISYKILTLSTIGTVIFEVVRT